MSGQELFVLGAGGHAKVVVAALRAGGRVPTGVLDEDPELLGSTVLGIPVTGRFDLLDHMEGVQAVIAIGSNRIRREIAKRYEHITWVVVVHPSAVVHDTVRLGAGTVICAGAVLQPDAVVGEHVILNTGATVDHDCVLGDYVHVAPGVHLAGNVRLDEGTFLGVGASVVPGRRIGAWTTVGAGGVVLYDLPADVTAIGVPARVYTKT